MTYTHAGASGSNCVSVCVRVCVLQSNYYGAPSPTGDSPYDMYGDGGYSGYYQEYDGTGQHEYALYDGDGEQGAGFPKGGCLCSHTQHICLVQSAMSLWAHYVQYTLMCLH